MSANPILAGSQSPSEDSPPTPHVAGEAKIEGNPEGKIEPGSEARAGRITTH
jgi:hypothetical protein